MTEQHRSRHHQNRQGDPDEGSKSTCKANKYPLSRRRVCIPLKEGDGDQGEEQHASNPEGRRDQMDPDKNNVKEIHLWNCTEIARRSPHQNVSEDK